MEKSCAAVGIDLGTAYSCISVVQDGQPMVIANEQGNNTTPSYVAFLDSERLIGDAAKRQAAKNPESTVHSTKRLIGQKFLEDSVQNDRKRWMFRVVNDDHKPKIQVMHKQAAKKLAPEQISAMILLYMKEMAEKNLERKVSCGVISIPSSYNYLQRQSVKAACEIAGINPLRVITAPTLAAIAYSIGHNVVDKRIVLVFDFGGGTLDVSIVHIGDKAVEVKSTLGDPHLGGDDFDNRIVDYCIEKFSRMNGIDISGDKRAVSRLRVECERAKKTLSSSFQVSINIDALCDGIDLNMSITRAQFEELNADLFEKAMEIVKESLRNASLVKSAIDDVVLVGGSSRIPKIQKLLQNIFDGKELNKSINADEAVANGAAMLAAILCGERCEDIPELQLSDIAPYSLGYKANQGTMATFFERNKEVPTKVARKLSLSGEDPGNLLVKVYEGERSVAAENTFLRELAIPEALFVQGVNEFEIFFNIDINQQLEVVMVNKVTGKKETVTISNIEGSLSNEEKARMIVDAEKDKKEAEVERERKLALNKVQSCAYSIRSHLQEWLGLLDKEIDWIDSHPSADKEILEQKEKQLKAIYGAVMPK